MTREQQLAIDDALRESHRLTAWERQFLSGLSRREEDYVLTPKQASCLRRIGDRLFVC
jgi:hypothetical protein